MKTKLIHMASFTIATYLSIAFISKEINPLNWDDVIRFLTVFLLGMSFLVYINNGKL